MEYSTKRAKYQPLAFGSFRNDPTCMLPSRFRGSFGLPFCVLEFESVKMVKRSSTTPSSMSVLLVV